MALKQLCGAKKEAGERFAQALPRKKAELLVDTPYAPLLPYYLLSDGGQLSDEYRFLSFAEAQEANAEFRKALEKEELLKERLSGAMFGVCADGDTLLLLDSGAVYRFSHEAPEIVNEWPNLAQFFMEETEV